MINQQTLPCFIAKANIKASDRVTLVLITASEYESWLRQQNEFTINWLMTNNFKVENESFCMLPNETGKVSKVLVSVPEQLDLYSIAHLQQKLPVGYYQLDEDFEKFWPILSLGFGLAAYRYTAFKKFDKPSATLIIPESVDAGQVQSQLQAIYLVRDLINTPAEHMGPEELSLATQTLAQHYQAEFSEILGEDLIKENYPAIYMVGRGSPRKPRLLELCYGDKSHPKVTLVGKGVCFDTGGLDLKSSGNMLLMKKDMGGAAHVLGLASLIMDYQLPVRLRVLIPAVENAISGTAYRPSDVIQTRKGLTVEVGNTDAEGRLILADALCEASSESPDLLIDIATLTGAARVAVGTEIAAMFGNQDSILNEILKLSTEHHDPTWPLPLYQPYKAQLESPIADLNNISNTGYAGATIAALFLQSFVDESTNWLHFDLMAYNIEDKPGRPKGGEAMGIRALFEYLKQRYMSNS